MKKTLFAIFALCSLSFGQTTIFPKTTVFPKTTIFGRSSASCTTPTGTNFTESFGDSSTSCWAAGPSSCNHTWTLAAGTPESIVTTPGTPPANTACTNSLQMALLATTADNITTTFTGIAGNFDIQGSIYVNSFPSSNAVTALCVAASGNDCTAKIMRLIIDNGSNCAPGGSLVADGSGANISACTSVALNSWHTFDLHHDSVAANCSLSVDGGSATTFTCNAGTPAFLSIGTPFATGPAMTYTIGNLFF